MYAGVVQRKEHFGPNEETPVRLRPPVPSFVGVAQMDLERGFPEPEAAGSIPAAHSSFSAIRGLGKWINPLGLGPRESRFESEVPDQISVG